MTTEYRMSLTELYVILNYMNNEYINKLPKKLINFIGENKDNSYTPSINKNIPINEQNLKKDTKVLLSLLYRNYWCDQENKLRLIEEDYEQKEKYEKELKEKFSTENLFKNNTRQNNIIKEEISNSNENVQMIEYKEQNIFSTIIGKIKVFFSKILKK